MIPYLGDFVEDDTVRIMFNTFTSDDPSASCTITNFIDTDVHVHKGDGLTQRNNAAGVSVSVDFDGITGSHMVKIDTSDDTVGGFWVTGEDYFVRIEETTIDGATVNAVIGHFSIENRYMRGTDSAALASALTTAQNDLDKLTGADGATLATSQPNYAPNITTPPTVAQIQAEIEEDGASILDTLRDDLADGGRLDLLIDDIKAATDALPADPADASNITAAFAVTDGKIDALNNIAVSDITGVEVDNDGSAISLEGAIKLILAVLTGKSSGGGTATVVFRNIGDSKNRISATVDADGNRTAVGTRDAT